jgi:hypothetical protein
MTTAVRRADDPALAPAQNERSPPGPKPDGSERVNVS